MTRRTLIAMIFAQTNAWLCNHPMWTIPNTGDGNRCNWDSCPMLPEKACDGIHGVFENDQCTVYCSNHPPSTETWECVDVDTWKLVSEPADCDSSISSAT